MAIAVGVRRLSQIVKDAGIHAFTKDDFYLVCNGVAQDPVRLVLVGGQAMEVSPFKVITKPNLALASLKPLKSEVRVRIYSPVRNIGDRWCLEK